MSEALHLMPDSVRLEEGFDLRPTPTDRSSRANAPLSARSLDATILFADLRRFSWLAATLGPDATFELLDDYVRLMVACLEPAGCLFDRCIGDALLAVFAMPEPAATDADQAVRAAIAMQRTLAAWNGQKAGSRPHLEAGIGINTDRIVAGSLGSPLRQQLTVIGDGVNVAARLEKACKHYGTDILVADSTRRRLGGFYAIRPVDRILFQGRRDAIEVFEVLDHRSATAPVDRIVDLSNEAIELFRQRRLAGAVRVFDRILALDPADGLARHYGHRCRALLRQSAVADWRPITVLPAA